MKRLVIAFLCLAAAAQSQDDDPLRFYRFRLDRTHAGNREEIRELLDISGNYRAFAHYLLAAGSEGDIGARLLGENWISLLRAWESSRLDKQLGVAPLVTRATAPAFLGVASESGALTRDSRSNLLTFRCNADGIARFLLGQDLFPCCDSGASPLRNASFSVSLDPLGSRIAGFGVRCAILHARDVRDSQVRAKWIRRTLAAARTGLAAPSASLLGSIGAAFENVETNPRYEEWLDRATADLAAAPSGDLASGLEMQLDTLAFLIRTIDPEIDGKLAAVLRAYDSYLGSQREYFRDITEQPALSVEYLQAGRTSRSVHVIFETNPGRGPGSLTANGGLTLDGPVRRWDVGVQYDHPIAPSTFFTLAAAYDGTNIVTEAGITFRFAGSGVRLPLALVWYDRSRGASARFGISLDMDALLMNAK